MTGDQLKENQWPAQINVARWVSFYISDYKRCFDPQCLTSGALGTRPDVPKWQWRPGSASFALGLKIGKFRFNNRRITRAGNAEERENLWRLDMIAELSSSVSFSLLSRHEFIHVLSPHKMDMHPGAERDGKKGESKARPSSGERCKICVLWWRSFLW